MDASPLNLSSRAQYAPAGIVQLIARHVLSTRDRSRIDASAPVPDLRDVDVSIDGGLDCRRGHGGGRAGFAVDGVRRAGEPCRSV